MVREGERDEVSGKMGGEVHIGGEEEVRDGGEDLSLEKCDRG